MSLMAVTHSTNITGIMEISLPNALIAGTQLRLVAAGSTAAHAAAQAQGMIYGTVQRQAVMLSFIDNFKLLGVVFFTVIPVLLLLKRPRGKPAGDVPVH